MTRGAPARGPGVSQPPPQRMAILRALQLGDLLCAVPVLRALRHAFPDTEITLIGLPWAEGFVRRFAHLCDAFLEFPGHPGLPEREADAAAWPKFLRRARARRFDVALQLHGSGERTNDIVMALGARSTAGFRPPGTASLDARRFVPWPQSGHEIHRLLALADLLGVPRAGEALEFPLAPEESAGAAALCAEHGLWPGRYACVHPGARLASRRWPVQHFATIAGTLAGAGLRVVVTGGPGEATLTAAVAAAVPDAVDLGGRTSLGVLGALLCDARLLVCNDTGVSHVAAALGTPSVVVSCGADPWRFAPLDRSRHEVIYANADCRPCGFDQCPIGHPCAYAVTPSHVAQRVLARLAATRAGVPRTGHPALACSP